MKLHEYLDEYGISKTDFAKETGISRSQISDICNDGFTNDNTPIVPTPDNVMVIHNWSDENVTYSDWYEKGGKTTHGNPYKKITRMYKKR